MSPICTLVDSFGCQMDAASSRGDDVAVISLLRSFREQLRTIDCPTGEIAKVLVNSVALRSWQWIDLWLIAALFHPAQEYVQSLCSILAIKEMTSAHEFVVDVLTELRNPASTRFLAQAVNYRISSDPGRHLAVKSLEALCIIGNEESLKIIRFYLDSDDQVIRERAAELLKIN